MLTYPQKRMAEKGLDPVAIVRTMNRGRRLSQREIKNRAAVVSRVLRNGNCGELYARRLARILDIDATYLELPRQCWPKRWRGDQGAAETPETTHAASGGRGCSPARRTTPKPNPRRIQVLRLLP